MMSEGMRMGGRTGRDAGRWGLVGGRRVGAGAGRIQGGCGQTPMSCVGGVGEGVEGAYRMELARGGVREEC